MSKNVGILSMQKVINYGSALQAYALKQLLLEEGANSVDFIDIRNGEILPEYKGKGRLFQLWQRQPLLHPINFIKDLLYSSEYHRSVLAGWNTIGIKADGGVDEKDMDLVVIGSDEVFNVCQPTSWGYSKQLYGDIRGDARVVSYAGSFGNTELKDLERLGLDKEIGQLMSRMSDISVRDANSVEIVESITGTKPLVHIDPVLAYGYKSEIANPRYEIPEKDYIVVYSYHRRISDKSEIQAIRNFAKKKGKKLMSVMCRYDWCDSYAPVLSPFNVLDWFKNADYIITDTFHGTIFSIITHSRFATLVRPSNRNKLTSLLDVAGLSSRAVDSPENIEKILLTDIDYSLVENALEPYRRETRKYLSHQLCSI